MSEPIQYPNQFMKGKTRHWFWGALTALLISVAVNYATAPLIPLLGDAMPRGALIAADAVKNLFVSGIVFAVLLAYGLCNTVKAYKVLFIILACFQAPNVITASVGNLNLINAVYRVRETYTALAIAAGALHALGTVAWVVCLCVMLFGRPASVALRIACVLLAAYLLFEFVYNYVLFGFIAGSLIRQMGARAFGSFILVLNLALNLLNVALHAFFFGAMSFSKRKRPKTAAGVLVQTPPA